MQTERIHIAHLINPVANPRDNTLAIAQPITFESIRVAAEKGRRQMTIDLLTAQYEEDLSIIPGFFRKTKCLECSVTNYHHFEHPVKLPLIKDLLARLYEETTADYLVYTNVDIALQPDFYIEVM